MEEEEELKVRAEQGSMCKSQIEDQAGNDMLRQREEHFQLVLFEKKKYHLLVNITSLPSLLQEEVERTRWGVLQLASRDGKCAVEHVVAPLQSPS